MVANIGGVISSSVSTKLLPCKPYTYKDLAWQ